MAALAQSDLWALAGLDDMPMVRKLSRIRPSIHHFMIALEEAPVPQFQGNERKHLLGICTMFLIGFY